MNSNWFHGYGDPPPQTVMVLGEHRDFVDPNFASWELTGWSSDEPLWHQEHVDYRL
jgi:hypothetical protein